MNTLFDAINNACAALPDNWTVHVHAENGAAWVELEAPDFETFEPSCPDDPLSTQIEQLIELAQAKAN
jgi:hypothetical protein